MLTIWIGCNELQNAKCSFFFCFFILKQIKVNFVFVFFDQHNPMIPPLKYKMVL